MDILNGLNKEQREAVMHGKGPLLLLAGAGSGKTRVLTHRIAYLIDECDVNPWHILALTFTNKAAEEMRERVDSIVGYGAEDIWVSTFHSTCVRILRRFIEPLGYTRSFTIYDADDQKSLMRDVCKYLQIDTKKYKERTILNAISSAKDECITPEDYILRAQGDYLKELYGAAYREYQKRLKSNNALDFDDLICKTIELFESEPETLKYYQRRFSYILVDEYQDTNSAQFKLISLLADGANEEGIREHNLCVVGDDDQSIYKFRGANIYNILNFEKLYPDAKVIKLEQNYRSTQTILDASNAVISNNTNRKEKALWSSKPKGEPVVFTQFETEYEEAECIADGIASQVAEAGYNYKDFAILYRTNAQSRVFEEKLVTKNIPYKIVGAVNFYQRREIKDLLAYLRTIDNGSDDVSVKRIINVPKRGIGLTTIDRINEYAIRNDKSFYDALASHEYIDGLARSSAKLTSFLSLIETLKQKLTTESYSLSELIQDIIDMTGYVRILEEEDTDDAQGRIENIEELVNKIVSYEEGEENPSLSGFLEEVALVADIDNVSEDNNLVLLMTLHSAKGLEFPCVYLCGMEDGVFPGYMSTVSDDPDELEEERRLCYVGITRAMDRLALSAARSRHRNGEMQFNRPSRFIDEIPRYLMTAGTSASYNRPRNIFQSGDSYPRSKDTDTSYQRPLSAADIIRQQNTLFDKPKKKSSGSDLFAGNPYISKGIGSIGTKEKKSRQQPPSPSSAPVNYTVGDKVSHMRFGNGTVLKMADKGADKEVTVAFDNGMERKMLASFAKLKKL